MTMDIQKSTITFDFWGYFRTTLVPKIWFRENKPAFSAWPVYSPWRSDGISCSGRPQAKAESSLTLALKIRSGPESGMHNIKLRSFCKFWNGSHVFQVEIGVKLGLIMSNEYLHLFFFVCQVSANVAQTLVTDFQRLQTRTSSSTNESFGANLHSALHFLGFLGYPLNSSLLKWCLKGAV